MKIAIVFLLLLFSAGLCAQTLAGKVVYISDGDTFTLLLEGKKKTVRVRLYGIDCPERGQPFGKVATDHVRNLISGKVVSVQHTDTDRYGRIVGIVTVGSINVNENLLKTGLAWHYKHFDKNPKWAKMEEAARENKKGLWSEKNPVAPWEWRKK